MGLIKLPAEDQAPEDQWSHPAYSGPCISLALASVVPINGLLRRIRIDVSPPLLCVKLFHSTNAGSEVNMAELLG